LIDEGVVGYLGRNGVLYCSLSCAQKGGQRHAVAIDLEEYDGLADRERLGEGVLCPVCGSPYRVDWKGRERE
jgi:hypothetical protein